MTPFDAARLSEPERRNNQSASLYLLLFVQTMITK